MDQRIRNALVAAASVVAVMGLAFAASTRAAAPGGRDSAARSARSPARVASTVSPRARVSPASSANVVPTGTSPTTTIPSAMTSSGQAEVATAGASASDDDAPRSQVPVASTPTASTSASSGDLRATLTARPGSGGQSSSFSFVLLVIDSSASGPVGPTSLTYGDGQPVPETGLPASCRAASPPAPTDESFDYSHTYDAPGTYDVSFTVASPCSSQQMVLELPVTVAAS